MGDLTYVKLLKFKMSSFKHELLPNQLDDSSCIPLNLIKPKLIDDLDDNDSSMIELSERTQVMNESLMAE